MSLRNLFFFVACVAVLAGCKSGDTAANTAADATVKTDAAAKADAAAGSLEGTWAAESADASGGGTTFEFKGDGSYVMNAEGPGPGAKPIKLEAGGTYKQADKQVTMHMTSMKLSSDDAETQKTLDKQSGAVAEGLKKTPDTVGTLEWKDKDTVSMTTEEPGADGKPAKKTFVMKRKAA